MEALLEEALLARFLQGVPPERYQQIMESVVNRNISPYEAVNTLLNGNRPGT
jgi:hypothetical protein